MLDVNWVCEEAFEEQEWVSELTVAMLEKEVLVDFDYDLSIPCVTQWNMLWFSASSQLNQTFDGGGIKTPKGTTML